MGLSLVIYVVIGIITRTSNPDQYYVAGRGVPAVLQRHGHRLGLDVGGVVHLDGPARCPPRASPGSPTSWAGRAATCCSPSSSAPTSASSAPTRFPDFLGARYGGNVARVIGVVAAIACSFTYLIAQVTGVGLIVSRFIGLDFNVGVFVGLLGVLFCSVLGGMKSVTWTQVAQYIILIVSYLVPVVYLSCPALLDPGPGADLRPAAPGRTTPRPSRSRGIAKEKETRALWKKDADEINAKIKAGGLSEAEVDKLKAPGSTRHPAGHRAGGQ